MCLSDSVHSLCMACAAIAATLLTCGSVPAATYTWTGASGPPGPFAFNNSWSNAGNWSGFAIPASSNVTDIVFGATNLSVPLQDLGDEFLVHSLTFNSP